MSEKTRQHNQLKRTQTPRTDSRSARERARAEAELAARKKRDLKIVIGIAVVVVLLGVGSGVGYMLWQRFGGPRAVPVAGPEQVITLADGQPIVYGTSGAKRVDIYLDFTCPHCGTFEKEQGANVKSLVESGEIDVAYHPIQVLPTQAPISERATNGFACAAQRGFGQAYMMQIFNNQELEWSDRQLVELARQVGGEAAGDITGCITGQQNKNWVTSMNNAPKPADFSGTPAIYVGDKQVQWQAGSSPEQFAAALRAA